MAITSHLLPHSFNSNIENVSKNKLISSSRFNPKFSAGTDMNQLDRLEQVVRTKHHFFRQKSIWLGFFVPLFYRKCSIKCFEVSYSLLTPCWKNVQSFDEVKLISFVWRFTQLKLTNWANGQPNFHVWRLLRFHFPRAKFFTTSFVHMIDCRAQLIVINSLSRHSSQRFQSQFYTMK